MSSRSIAPLWMNTTLKRTWLLCLTNDENYQVGVPFAGKYKEVFNSDAAEFGGEGVVNARVKTAKAEEWDEREYSIKVKLPALGVSIYSCTPGKAPAKRAIASKAVK